MKLFLKLFSITIFSLVFGLENYSISNSQILKICARERREKLCIKRLKLNRELLNEGNPIEIPVYPYKPK